MTKRPHCDLIKAWADGAEIQYLHPTINEWMDVPGPMWTPEVQYRIKSQTIKYRVALFFDIRSSAFHTATTESEDNDWEESSSFVRWLTDWVEVEVDNPTP